MIGPEIIERVLNDPEVPVYHGSAWSGSGDKIHDLIVVKQKVRDRNLGFEADAILISRKQEDQLSGDPAMRAAIPRDEIKAGPPILGQTIIVSSDVPDDVIIALQGKDPASAAVLKVD
jgi:hypothetical protein